MHRKFLEENLLIASNNKHKIAEIKEYFKNVEGLKFNFFTPEDFNISSPDETEETFTGNAELKARYYGNISGMPALADDTGVCIEALGGLPGVYTANWISESGSTAKFVSRVEKELCKHSNKAAEAVCVLSLYWPADGHIESFMGKMYGALNFSFKSLKVQAIGFQKIFVPNGQKKPYALMSFKQKQRISHRGKAFKKLIKCCFS